MSKKKIVGTKALNRRDNLKTRDGLDREIAGVKLTNANVQDMINYLSDYKETGCEVSLFMDKKKTNDGKRMFDSGFFIINEPYTPADAEKPTVYLADTPDAVENRINATIAGA